ncbi:hypothetical protein [Desulfobotulus mexicanus]|uniref:Uncharacterized protein n=1 Tax=Desulfobotulus mexicanus TaxID=2586642 RepID=A0A5Q4VHK7_9BACT|nr:hypothetical protein [Desulfobotulus mexicanus]TYT75481.1 hypothetical protein FIM25_05225 [Desulfobotulus mexicanus]
MTIDKLLMLVEDDPEINASLELLALRYFGADTDVELCVGQNIQQIIDLLAGYVESIPQAKLYAVLDYNLSINLPGEQKPVEALFYHAHFRHFLKNGGIIIIYNGYPEQLRQSNEILATPSRYPDIAFFTAEKAKVAMEDIFKIIKAAVPEKLPEIRRQANHFQHDLEAMLHAIRTRKESMRT